MLTVNNLSVQFGKRILFDEVNTTFTQGNCYGVIGANGAGKSTFLKILAGDIDPTSGRVFLEPGKRMSVLNQNHNMFDDHTVLETVMMGNKVLFKVKSEMDALYADYDDANADSTLMSRLTELNKALSQMMRNTSERKIVEELHTYQLAIKKTLSVMTKKQLLTKSETSNEYEDRLERGDFS